MTIIERAMELIPDGATVGLGSGRTAEAFVRALAERIRAGRLNVKCVSTSSRTAELASKERMPTVALREIGTLDVTIDGADEVDPNLDLIKGYGRSLFREKIVAASSGRLVILVGTEKLVPRLGSRGILPVEVLPFAWRLCERRLRELGCDPTLWAADDEYRYTDNRCFILDCAIQPLEDPARFELQLRAIPGVVCTGLFLGMADVVLVGEGENLELKEERHRPGQAFAAR
jgi:ribose 5-phosphate isomerase A